MKMHTFYNHRVEIEEQIILCIKALLYNRVEEEIPNNEQFKFEFKWHRKSKLLQLAVILMNFDQIWHIALHFNKITLYHPPSAIKPRFLLNLINYIWHNQICSLQYFCLYKKQKTTRFQVVFNYCTIPYFSICNTHFQLVFIIYL